MRHARKKSPIERAAKQHWIDRALETEAFHIFHCKEYPGWTIIQTSKLLLRSEGSVNEDIMIASWMKTNENQLRSFKYKNDALDFIRDRKLKIKLSGYEG